MTETVKALLLEHALAAASLPSLPATLKKIRTLSGHPRCTTSILGGIAGACPAIAFAMLARANRLTPPEESPILDLPSALLRLGQPSCRSLLFEVEPSRGEEELLIEAWSRRSYATAVMTRCLVRQMRRVSPSWQDQNIVFTAGLLHDVGTGMAIHLATSAVQKAMARLEYEHAAPDDLIAEEIGIHPGVLGAKLLGRWGLPQLLRTLALSHQAPRNKLEEGSLSQLVQVARILVAAIGIGHRLNPWALPIEPEDLGRINLTIADIQPILHAFLEEWDRWEMHEDFTLAEG